MASVLDEVWEKISENIEYIFQFQTIRYSKWMLTYTYIFDYCSNNNSNSEWIYKKIENYFEDYLRNQSIDDVSDEKLLETYANFHEKYRRSSKIFHGICSYLHRHYVKRERDSGNSNIDEIYILAMKIWNQILAPLVYKRITKICLNMIKTERDNQPIDTDLIGRIVQILIPSNINELNLQLNDNNRMLDVYQEYFEKDYLQETQDFYRFESMKYLQQYSIKDYLFKIAEYIDIETHRVTVYLHSSTFIKIIKALEKVLIDEHLNLLCTEAKNSIENENIQEINHLFRTVNRIENGKNPLKILFENHIHQLIHLKIDSIQLPANHDLKIYIETIADLHQKYSQFIQIAFDNDYEFIQVLNRTFEKILNDNSIIRIIGNTTHMARILAQYCDRFLLRKRPHDDIDHEKLFDYIKIFLIYIHDKDIFSKFYLRFLAKRLVNHTSISNDYEKIMIANIQISCGFEYAIKLKQIYQDTETSQIILNQYSNIDSKIHFNILVFNSNVWSLPTIESICLPQRLQNIVQDFNQFYSKLYQGRKLTWLHQYSQGELQAYFQKKFYIFRVSIYEMTVLLLFNDVLELTIEQIQDRTQIKIDQLVQILNLLLNSKILISNCEINLNTLDINSPIRLAENFFNEKSRVNLNLPIKTNEEFETDFVLKTINRDQITIIRAAIVRTMKVHKKFNEQLLIQNIIEQLKPRFNCQISVIKNCIETLINEAYLERDINHMNEFIYKN